MKRVTLMLLACVMLLGCILTGCSPKDKEKNGSRTNASSRAGAESAESGLESDSAESGAESTGEASQSNQSGGPTGANNSGGGGGGYGSLPPAKPGEVIQASFTRNADGTCTDRTTGVIFLDDDLDNWDKVKEKGADLMFDSNEAALMDGDSSRAVRTGAANNAWFTYQLNAGITEVGVITYVTNTGDGKITIFVSKDNKAWTKTNAAYKDISLGFGWSRRIWTVKGIDKANKYVKIDLGKNEKVAYDPNIGRLRINNIDKMNDADRYLENRASATFYVDSKAGSDTNDGMSEAKAFKSLFKVSAKFFQPGDKLLFKKGNTYNGSLVIKGYGTDANPIQIGSYGSGAAPKISARGGTAVTIKATQIKFDGFEITNPSGLIGINVIPAGSGANKNITISNCNIHDINYTAESDFEYERSGAIIVYADGADPVWYDGMQVLNNTIQKTSRMGILYTTQWAWRPGRWGKNSPDNPDAGLRYVNDDKNWFVFVNSKIAGNTLTDIRGDGIMACGAKGLLIEKNTVYNAYSTAKNFNTAVAGLWTTNTNDSVIQYNEVGYTKLPPGGTDGDGYDIDISEIRTTVQYNYSHNNDGGFLLICNFADGNQVSKNAVVRYNLSVNDGLDNGNTGYFIITGKNPGTQIYNNTFYSTKNPNRPVSMVHIFGDEPEDFTFTNNIFAGDAGVNCRWTSANHEGDFAQSVKNFKFINNIFHNVPQPPAGSGVSLSGNKNADPNFAVKNWSVAEYKNMAGMIKAFTPGNKIAGASSIANNGGKDISGAAVTAPFYGCVKY